MAKHESNIAFEAFGHTFTPKRKFRKGETFDVVLSKVTMIGIDNRNGSKWNYNTFYKIAKKAGCGDFDIYIMDGKIQVTPAWHELYGYR